MTGFIKSAAALAASLTLSAAAFAQEPEMTIIPAGQERPGDHVKGDEDAPVLMVEYASVVCPHCASFHNDVYSVLGPEYVETGQVRWVMREMVTQPAQLAFVGFMLAECAPDDRYFDALDLLFFEQRNLFEDAQSEGGALARYNQIAGAVGMSEEDLGACLGNQAVFDSIQARHEQAIADGVRSTPSFFIAGEPLAIVDGENGGAATYHWGGEALIIDGEPVEAVRDAATFRRILDHFIAEA
jgi:protein-disulfide isomerase